MEAHLEFEESIRDLLGPCSEVLLDLEGRQISPDWLDVPLPAEQPSRTAARRAPSSSSRSTLTRCCIVSGWLARTTASIAFC